MTEFDSALHERLRSDVPEGHSYESGYCFKDALNEAGYDTELPPWIHIDDIPIVCGELGFAYKTGQGERVTLKKGKPCIIGYIVQRRGEGEKRIGHWSFFRRAEDMRNKIQQKDIFAIIELPS